MAQCEKNILRTVGNLEKFSTIPHNLGYYFSVANTARYRTSSTLPPELLDSIIETAVAQVVLKHPALCCGIINEDTNDPSFIRLDSIDLSNRIRYEYHLPQPAHSEDEALVEALEFQHGESWRDLDSQPPWKIIIITTVPTYTRESKSPQTRDVVFFDVIFAFHHALADGLSGVVFHRSMLEALNNPNPIGTSLVENHILQIPTSITLALPLEKAVIFKISWIFFLKTLWESVKPTWLSLSLFASPTKPWTGASCSGDDLIREYKTNVTLVEISPDVVSGILAACKEEGATVTGLLHGLIIASLAKRVPSAGTFVSATPYSMRHLTGMSNTDEMGVHVGSLKTRYPTTTISDIRAASKDPSETISRIWETARSFRTDMLDELAGLPNDNLMGMIPYISDLRKMFMGMLGKRRSTTYEVSNVGRVDGGGQGESEGGKWWIERDVFSQSASVTGAAVYFNVASVVGGPLMIAITWMEAVVESDLVEGVRGDLEYSLKCVGEGKDVLLGG